MKSYFPSFKEFLTESDTFLYENSDGIEMLKNFDVELQNKLFSTDDPSLVDSFNSFFSANFGLAFEKFATESSASTFGTIGYRTKDLPAFNKQATFLIPNIGILKELNFNTFLDFPVFVINKKLTNTETKSLYNKLSTNLGVPSEFISQRKALDVGSMKFKGTTLGEVANASTISELFK